MTGMESDGFCHDSGYKYTSALSLADNILIYCIITITPTTLYSIFKLFAMKLFRICFLFFLPLNESCFKYYPHDLTDILTIDAILALNSQLNVYILEQVDIR